MRFRKKSYVFFRFACVIFTMIVLAWLTIGTSFIYENQQKKSDLKSAMSQKSNAADENEFPNNPVANDTEEQNESSVLMLSEYIHHTNEVMYFSAALKYEYHADGHYIAFYRELLPPPPKV